MGNIMQQLEWGYNIYWHEESQKRLWSRNVRLQNYVTHVCWGGWAKKNMEDCFKLMMVAFFRGEIMGSFHLLQNAFW